MADMIFSLLLLVAGYVFGSIPFGLVLCRLAGYGDIRNIGSGNIGATNVLRTGNKFLAFLTLLLDSGKGALPIIAFLAFNQFTAAPLDALTIGMGAILGHNFPVWLGFKGGKGVSTTLGTLLAAVPYAGLLACVCWLAVAVLGRISSLSALCALLAGAAGAFFLYGPWPGMMALIIALIGFIRHKDNIRRLIRGEEPKIGASSSKK